MDAHPRQLKRYLEFVYNKMEILHLGNKLYRVELMISNGGLSAVDSECITSEKDIIYHNYCVIT